MFICHKIRRIGTAGAHSAGSTQDRFRGTQSTSPGLHHRRNEERDMVATVSEMHRYSRAVTIPLPVTAPIPAEPAAVLDAKLAELVGAVYAGTMESPPWQALIEMLLIELDASSVVLMLRPPGPEGSGSMVHCGGQDIQAKDAYEKHFFALDPFVRLEEGKAVTVEELIGTDTWLQCAIYRDYMRQIDIRHIIGADVYTRDGTECRLRATRGHGGRPFGDAEKSLLQYLLPHLKRAIQLHSRIDSLECERQVFAGTVNRMLLGVISMSQTGEIIEMNPEARRILAQKDGIWLSGHTLYAESSKERRDLQRAIQQAMPGGSDAERPAVVEAMPVTRPSGEASLVVMVRSIPPGRWSESRARPAVAVFIRDPNASAPQSSHELARRLFGFTRVEARLALLLVDGLTLDEAATRLTISRNTARTHLRSIFCKAGVTRQTLLVKLILNSVVALG
jgi:DNA-binding CsgD family transcriptional regulator